MANPSTAHEPSMEEILASIRQIISEDGEAAPAAPATDAAVGAKGASVDPHSPSAPSQSGGGSGSVPEKPQVIDSPSSKAAPNAAPEPTSRTSPTAQRTETPVRPAPSRRPEAPQSTWANSRPPEGRNLLSADSDAAVSGAFSALAHTILAQNARTLEDLVAEMLRPMLREWLDDNLPGLVERLVKEEIQRVSRGRR